MNLYFCTNDPYIDTGLFIAAETAGQAKYYFRQYDGQCAFIEVRAWLVRKEILIAAGVYDDNCEVLSGIGVHYLEEEEK